MRKNHQEFLKAFQVFKTSLLDSNSTNLKYLQCRLDFNEYYHALEIKNAQMINAMKARGGGDEVDFDDLDDYGEDDDDDEDDDDEDDDDDDDDDEGDDDDL